MPDFFGVLLYRPVGGEFSGAGYIIKAFSTEFDSVYIISVCPELGIQIGCVVQKEEIMVCSVPMGAVQQGVVQLPLGIVRGDSAVHKGIDGSA